MKTYYTIGCCGIDCGLCPRFQTKSNSACPGCGGMDFKVKHPSCGFLTCCFIKRNLEACSLCQDFPCSRFNPEKEGYDSFVTHKKVFPNLEYIKTSGIDSFIKLQKTRIEILEDFLTHFDDGRSKSYFCLACALLPVEDLLKIQRSMKGQNNSSEIRSNNKLLKDELQKAGEVHDIILKLNVCK